jgi:hypothetical protein
VNVLVDEADAPGAAGETGTSGIFDELSEVERGIQDGDEDNRYTFCDDTTRPDLKNPDKESIVRRSDWVCLLFESAQSRRPPCPRPITAPASVIVATSGEEMGHGSKASMSSNSYKRQRYMQMN